MADNEKLPATEAGGDGGAEKAPAQGKDSAKKKGKRESAGISRRSMCIGAGSTAALLVLGGLRYAGHNPVCRPPGGQDEAKLVSACIRCEKCYQACPRRVIVPAHIEDGLLGMRSPMLNFDNDYCDFCAEENGGHPLCAATCPTKALTLPEGANAHNAVIGVAEIDRQQCLAYRDTGCRYCYDACVKAGYNAIELDNTGGDYSARPHVVADKCVGCGACESVCVSQTAGSYVAGSTERAIVVKPASSKA